MKRLIIYICVFLAVSLAAAGAVLLWGLGKYRSFLDTPINPPGGEGTIDVELGTNLRALGRQLEAAGLIEDVDFPVLGSLFYFWAHKIEEAGPRIRSGEYLFEGPHRPGDILDAIIAGRVRTYRVTIPEGLRLDEIMPLFEEAGVGNADELFALATDPEFTRSVGIKADNLEGYVFPTTYHLPRGLSARRILEGTVSHFDAAWRLADSKRKEEVKLSRHEAVTLASIIEKETGQGHERPKISCVFHNRLKNNWKLQTDPTVIYAKILRLGRWDGRLTKTDLEIEHPYNTYTTRGLPPGPIASPGTAALEAALNPPECPYFFFVSRNDGSHEFCIDYTCHSRAVRRWQNPRYGLD